jgi:hypothetical protein
MTVSTRWVLRAVEGEAADAEHGGGGDGPEHGFVGLVPSSGSPSSTVMTDRHRSHPP